MHSRSSKKLSLSLLASSLLLAGLAGCGGPLGPGAEDSAETSDGSADAVAGDPKIPDDGRCTGTPAIRLPTAGVTLSRRESYWVCWVAKNVVPNMASNSHIPSDADRRSRASRAAAVTWWSLSEGVLGLDDWSTRNPILHSLCDDSGSQIGGGVTCHSTWQTGIAAGQVLDRDWQELYDATREVYPNHSVDEVIRWTAGKWATPTQQRYIYADMRSELAKSWAIRNPALGFELVYEHEVANDCLNAVERPWNCFVNRRRRSTDQSRKYAKTQQLSNQVISDLSSAIYGLL